MEFQWHRREVNPVLTEFYHTSSQLIPTSLFFLLRVIGARRDNHGNYTVSVDGVAQPPLNGFHTPNIFNQTLFEVANLTMGPHTIKIVNDGSIDPAHGDWSWFDVDYVTFDALVANAAEGAPNEAQVYDDTNPAFKYLPDASAWKTYGNSDGAFNSTITQTTDPKGLLEFRFEGDAVALYGPLNPQNGQYVVSIDGHNQPVAWANYTSNVPASTLFMATQLGVGPHVLRVTNYPAGGSQNAFSIDYARVWGTPASAQPKKKSHVGPIVGGAVGGVLFLAVIIGLLLFFLRRRRYDRRAPARDVLSDPGEMVDVPREAATISPYKDASGPYYVHHIGSQSSVSGTGVLSSTYVDNANSEASTGTSSTGALLVQNHTGEHDAAQLASHPPIPADALAYLQRERQRSGKNARLGAVPPSQQTNAQYQMAARDPEVLRQERMVVEGRPQDFGPVDTADLPPDYRQAIQPPV